MSDVYEKIKRRWVRLRLQPIRVFCFHHVCQYYDAASMKQNDWLNIEIFKVKITNMRKVGVKFISLQDAHKHIKYDFVRFSKYAVITFDDGYASLKEVLPWLEEQQIPVTLFINGKYLDGKSYRRNPNEQYLTKEELWALRSPLVEIGSHGWEHNCVAEMTSEEFAISASRNINLLEAHPNYIPFWAYTYGVHSNMTDVYLCKQGLVPIFIDGLQNYNERAIIHRELI